MSTKCSVFYGKDFHYYFDYKDFKYHLEFNDKELINVPKNFIETLNNLSCLLENERGKTRAVSRIDKLENWRNKNKKVKENI